VPAPNNVSKIVLARVHNGRTEFVEWIRDADVVWIVADGHETIIGPDEWEQSSADLTARGFVEVYPNDQRKMEADKDRVLNLVRNAFRGVVLGDGVGLRQGQGLDDYADEHTLAAYRALDEKENWSAISVSDLDRCYSSLSFFDADGMRFHLPAYLIADLEERLQTAEILFHLIHFAHGAESRFETLSPIQRECVRQFLLFRLSDHHRDFAHSLIEAALRDYWTVERNS